MNFALILFLVTLATGILWLIDVLYARKLRAPGSKNPIWVEWGASLFPVILAVFALRSFVVEPFKIPSGSMIPTLQVGDYILVNKFTYGLRLPIIGTQIVGGKPVARGEGYAGGVQQFGLGAIGQRLHRSQGGGGEGRDRNRRRGQQGTKAHSSSSIRAA